MPADLTRLVKELSRHDIEKLLAAKDELETLESRRQELLAELAGVEKRLEKLAGRVAGRGAKPTVRRRAKTAAKKVTRKTTKKAAKKTAKKATRKTVAKKAAPKGKLTVEDVVVELIKSQGGPMSFKEILAAITKGKLVKTKSKSFDNVLRRTLSTSKRVKRVARGVYNV